MFENSKELLRGWGFNGSGTPNPVYLGTNEIYNDNIAIPLSLGSKNDYNPATDAEKISVVITCIKILSDTISRLPLHIYQDSDKGHLPDKLDYRYKFLHYSPDEIINSQSFFSALEYNRNFKGNSFALISRNRGTGKVTGLHFIPSNYIGGYKIKGSELYYVYYEPQPGTNKTKEKLINSSEVLHFKMTTKNSFWGINPLEAQRQNMSTIFKSKSTIDTFFENNAFTPKVLKSTIPDAAFQKTVVEAVQKFRDVNVGVGNAGKIITLPPFTEIQELNLNVVDQQFITGQKFDAAQVASFYGVPPHMVGIMEYSKFNNVEQMALDFKVNTISSIARMYRQELEFKLLTEEERIEGKSIEFALNSLLELDTAAKTAYYKSMRNELGALTSNQICLFEGLPTFEGGDVHIMPLNYGVISKTGAVIPTNPPTVPAPPKTPERSFRGAKEGNTNACKKGKFSTSDSNFCEGSGGKKDLTDEEVVKKIYEDAPEKFKKGFKEYLEKGEFNNEYLADLLGSYYITEELDQEVKDFFGGIGLSEEVFEEDIMDFSSGILDWWTETNMPEGMEFGSEEFEEWFSEYTLSDVFNTKNVSAALLNNYFEHFKDDNLGLVNYINEPYLNDDFIQDYKKELLSRPELKNINIGIGKDIKVSPEQGGSFKRPGRSLENRGAPEGNTNACKKGKFATSDSNYCEGTGFGKFATVGPEDFQKYSKWKPINPEAISEEDIKEFLQSKHTWGYKEGKPILEDVLKVLTPGYAKETYGYGGDFSGIFLEKYKSGGFNWGWNAQGYYNGKPAEYAEIFISKDVVLKLAGIKYDSIGLGIGKGLNKSPEQGGSFKRPGRSLENRGAKEGNTNACKKGKYSTEDSNYCQGAGGLPVIDAEGKVYHKSFGSKEEGWDKFTEEDEKKLAELEAQQETLYAKWRETGDEKYREEASDLYDQIDELKKRWEYDKSIPAPLTSDEWDIAGTMGVPYENTRGYDFTPSESVVPYYKDDIRVYQPEKMPDSIIRQYLEEDGGGGKSHYEWFLDSKAEGLYISRTVLKQRGYRDPGGKWIEGDEKWRPHVGNLIRDNQQIKSANSRYSFHGKKVIAQRYVKKEDLKKILGIKYNGIGIGAKYEKSPEQGGSFKRPGRSLENRGAKEGK